MAKKRKVTHYVDNEEFLNRMVEFRNCVIKAKEEDESRPRIPDYIGECFIKIATHLSYKPNFINYTFREDMIADGVENCLQYIDNFDPAKSKNPFAYFTQIIYYAFLRRIQKEKKQLYIKYRAIEQAGLTDELIYQNNEYGRGRAVEGNYRVEPKMYENIQEFIETFENTIKKQKQKAAKKKKGLENFVDKEKDTKQS